MCCIRVYSTTAKAGRRSGRESERKPDLPQPDNHHIVISRRDLNLEGVVCPEALTATQQATKFRPHLIPPKRPTVAPMLEAAMDPSTQSVYSAWIARSSSTNAPNACSSVFAPNASGRREWDSFTSTRRCQAGPKASSTTASGRFADAEKQLAQLSLAHSRSSGEHRFK